MTPVSDVRFDGRGVSRTSIALFLVLSALLCALAMWPALINGFPLVWDDTRTYLEGKNSSRFWPIFYSLFVATGRHAGSPWVPVIIQSALTTYILTRSISLLGDIQNLITFIIAAAILGVSQLPWLTSYILADLFGGVSILCVIMLILKWERMHAFDRLLFFGTALFGAVAATANAFVLLPLGAGMLVANRAIWRANRLLRLAATAFALITIVLPLATNAIWFGHLTYAGGASARLFSKLVDNGIAVPFLRTNCESSHYHACDHLELISNHVGDEGFLWDGPAYADNRQAWRDDDGDYGKLVRRIVLTHPIEVATFVARDVFVLAGRVTYTPRDMLSFADDSMSKQIPRLYPPYDRAFKDARQQQESLTQIYPEKLYSASVVVSFALTLFCFWFFRRSGNQTAASFTLWILCGLVGSLIVHGGLSQPIPRYNVKVSWLLWIPPAAFLIRMFPDTRRGPSRNARFPGMLLTRSPTTSQLARRAANMKKQLPLNNEVVSS